MVKNRPEVESPAKKARPGQPIPVIATRIIPERERGKWRGMCNFPEGTWTFRSFRYWLSEEIKTPSSASCNVGMGWPLRDSLDKEKGNICDGHHVTDGSRRVRRPASPFSLS